MENSNWSWDSNAFFEKLTLNNKLAASLGAVFCRVAGLNGFQEALAKLKSANCIVAASDIDQGTLYTDNTPHTRKAKLVMMALRCPFDDLKARERAMATLRELFRQFASMTLLEKSRLENNSVFIDDRISFNEMEKHFFNSMACCYFQLAVTSYCDLSFNPDEWIT